MTRTSGLKERQAAAVELRPLIYSVGVSLDGYIAGPRGEGDWAAPDAELHRFHNEQARDVDLHLLGSRLYGVMSYWETAEERYPAAPKHELEFARIWKQLPKLVYSKSLEAVEGNTRLSRGDPVQAVRELKQQDGGPIAVGGEHTSTWSCSRRGPSAPGSSTCTTAGSREGDAVSATVLYMSVSLDGFVAGPNEGPGNGLGDGGHRLHEWAMTDGDVDLDALSRSGGVNGKVVDEFMSTGATVAGRGTFEPAGGWGGDHHDGVPIFILARDEPGIDISQWPLVTYVEDVTTAMTKAKEAAGDRNVLVHGAGVARLALAAGVLDELELHVVPVLFGQGRRLFENLAPEQIELRRTRILEGEGGVTHMHYSVQR